MARGGSLDKYAKTDFRKHHIRDSISSPSGTVYPMEEEPYLSASIRESQEILNSRKPRINKNTVLYGVKPQQFKKPTPIGKRGKRYIDQIAPSPSSYALSIGPHPDSAGPAKLQDPDRSRYQRIELYKDPSFEVGRSSRGAKINHFERTIGKPDMTMDRPPSPAPGQPQMRPTHIRWP